MPATEMQCRQLAYTRASVRSAEPDLARVWPPCNKKPARGGLLSVAPTVRSALGDHADGVTRIQLAGPVALGLAVAFFVDLVAGLFASLAAAGVLSTFGFGEAAGSCEVATLVAWGRAALESSCIASQARTGPARVRVNAAQMNE